MRAKATLIITILAMLGGVVVGCAAPEAGVPKQELVIGVARYLQDYGPPPWGTGPWAGVPLVYESLVQRTLDGEVEPLLADSWEISQDGRVYTFQLRKRISFHDGTPFNADSVKFSFEYCVEREPGLGGAEAIEVVDDYTVKIILNKPNPLFFSEMNFYILGPASVGENGKVTKPVGTGPFMFEEYVKDQYYTMVRNPDYWQGAVKLEKVIFKVIPDVHTRTIALEAGEVDMIGIAAGSHLPAEDIPRLRDNPALKLSEKVGFRSNVVQFNPEQRLFSDLRVRKAICLAIDKGAINKILGERGMVIDGPFVPGSPWFNSKVSNYYPYSLDEAKRLLATAGWKDTDGDGVLDKGEEPFKVTFVTSVVAPEWPKIAEIVQANLKNIGIEVEIQQLEKGAHFAAIRKGRFDITIKVFGGALPPVDLSPYMSQPIDPWPPGIIIKDADLDRLIDRYQTSNNREEMIKTCHEIQEAIMEKAPILFHYVDYRIPAMNKKILGFKPGPDWCSLRHLWKAHISE